MPKIIEERYRGILKVEFKDMLVKFLNERELYHAYAIGRACTQGTMLGFDYRYYTVEGNPNVIGKLIDLEEYGEIHFYIDVHSNYGKIVTKNSDEIIQNFLDNYSDDSSIKRDMPYN